MVQRAKVRFLATDIWDAPDNGKRYEVIDGALYVSPAPSWFHQEVVAALVGLIWPFVRRHRLGRVVPAPTGVVLDDENGVEPDLIFVSRERESIMTARGIEGAPDLLVEVLSPGTAARDRGIKMRRYAASGVAHHWLIDPLARTLEAYRLAEEGYSLVGRLGAGEVFHPEVFPGLAIPLGELWS